MSVDFFSYFVTSFVTLFIVIDPVLVTPIFASLTRHDAPKKQRQIAIQACLLAAGLLSFFGFLGGPMLHHLGIDLAAFRAAGGILLFLMGFRMFFEPESEVEAKTPGPKASARENVAFFPIAIPMLAGPGAIATVMLLMSEAKQSTALTPILAQTATISAMLVTLLIGMIIMFFAGRIANALGNTGMQLISRLLGMLLMALATQYVFDGIRMGILERVVH